MNDRYDPNEDWRPPRRSRAQQSRLSTFIEALGGGLVVAVVVMLLKGLLNW